MVRENAWIDNLDEVIIGNNVCISQGALLLTGNHDYTLSTFNYRNAPIIIEDGAWIGAKTVICPGVKVKSHAILTVGSTATRTMEAYGIYQGNPAQKFEQEILQDKIPNIMKVSIITSCYNREATIRGAIESVLEQDYPDIEYIVVDGASKDNSLAVINEYKNGIDTIISEPDKGMYEAINKGIRAATGDIIGLIHSDDFLFSSHTISEIVKTFEEQDADMIYGNGVFVDYDDTNQMIRNWISGRYSKKNVKNGWLPLHPTVYIKKECMDKWGLYDESYKIAADSDLLVRYLYEADLKVYYLNKYIVKMRMGAFYRCGKKQTEMGGGLENV